MPDETGDALPDHSALPGRLPDPAKRTLRCGPWEDRPDGSSVCQKCGRVDFDLDLGDGEEPADTTPFVSMENHARVIEALADANDDRARLRAENVNLDDALMAAVEEQDRLRGENEARSRDVGRLWGEVEALKADMVCRWQEITALLEPVRALVEGRINPGARPRPDFWPNGGQWTVWMERGDWENYRDLLEALTADVEAQAAVRAGSDGGVR